MYDLNLKGQIIEFTLVVAIIGSNLVRNQWIIFILGQNNLLEG
jgi:hypothetical protein